MLTQERLKELLHYDPETGIFINLIQRSSRAKKDAVAGYEDTEGYVKIEIYGKPYLAHRLVWFYVYGSFPEICVDHKNEIKNDNRITNLRLATNQENRHNISNLRNNNTSGFIGVAWNKENKKWRSQIQINNKKRFLGYFDTPEEASESYLKAKRELHPFWIEEKVI